MNQLPGGSGGQNFNRNTIAASHRLEAAPEIERGGTLLSPNKEIESGTLRCAVVRHVEIEDLGYLGEGLQRGGVEVDYIDAWDLPTEPVPDAAGLVVLGGPMAVYEIDRHPYLAREIELIRRYIHQDRPVLGVCLGAQLLAAAGGARVYPGAEGKEIGWFPVELTAGGREDPLWAGFPTSFTTFHWHGDTFDLPAGAELLARSDRYPQSFRIGRHAYGVQFHPEIVPTALESWIRAYRLELARERLDAEDVLAVPDLQAHRALATRFGKNVATWMHRAQG
ncbi:MAG: gamma-glutamyl-gamma-aminobutyrate hydrolase family protein [Gemmatimonadota bacterium]|nr:MAG: gamma-glutamyl-gamma-aminobutyrate hydrolase family protein [Gemmatimonadota bacterium]